MTTHVTIKGWAPKVGILLALAGATTLTIAIDVWLSSANRHVLPRKGGLLDLLLIVVVVLLTLALHEAIHGVAFLGFGGRPRYRIGLAMGMPSIFVAVEGFVVRWWQMLIIGISPFVVLTALATALALIVPAVTLAAVLMVSVNVIGACIDLYLMVRLLACRVRYGPGLVTDTRDGFIYDSAAVLPQAA
ncbi:MAG TPA: DUF3267 domain-containing protein [Propionibacteriaceae bacterium]|jgi:hypothetical protein